MTANELSNRLEHLERENRRMKRAGFAVVGVALAVALTGAATPHEMPDVIEARVFRVIDEKGALRAVIGEDGIVYADEKGTARAMISENAIAYFDEKGEARAAMGATGFAYYDEKGVVRAAIPRTDSGYADHSGTSDEGVGGQPVAKRPESVFSALLGAVLIAEDGTYLGVIDGPTAADSIVNEYGPHGGAYSSKSIGNQYGTYGGRYSAYSPFNPYTSTPPRIFKDGALIAYLTVNQALSPKVDPAALIGWLKTR